MKNLFFTLLLIFSAFIGLIVLIGALALLSPEWSNSTIGLLTMQGVQTIVLFGVTTLIGVWLTEKHVNPFKQISLNVNLTLKQGIMAFLFAVAALPCISMLAEWNKGIELPSFLTSIEEMMRQMEESAKELTDQFLNTSSVGMVFVNLFVMAFLPALCEEMMFRGWLQRVLCEKVNYHTAIWVSAFIFSAIHFQFYGFIPRMLIGAALGYLYQYTKSLWAPIIAHFTNNATAVITAFLTYNGSTSINFDTIGIGNTWYLTLVSIALCLTFIHKIRISKNSF